MWAALSASPAYFFLPLRFPLSLPFVLFFLFLALSLVRFSPCASTESASALICSIVGLSAPDRIPEAIEDRDRASDFGLSDALDLGGFMAAAPGEADFAPTLLVAGLRPALCAAFGA